MNDCKKCGGKVATDGFCVQCLEYVEPLHGIAREQAFETMGFACSNCGKPNKEGEDSLCYACWMEKHGDEKGRYQCAGATCRNTIYRCRRDDGALCPVCAVKRKGLYYKCVTCLEVTTLFPGEDCYLCRADKEGRTLGRLHIKTPEVGRIVPIGEFAESVYDCIALAELQAIVLVITKEGECELFESYEIARPSEFSLEGSLTCENHYYGPAKLPTSGVDEGQVYAAGIESIYGHLA